MEVQLYVYDLTRGVARGMSQQLLGIQIDAVYHTSLVFNNIEYLFGRGIQTCYPGRTHHGQPMEIIPMGATHLPMETIMDYLDSLKDIYTPESYDLFSHNCNNFTNDFGMFLVGKGIPDHITNLPRRILDTPFGQMLKPQLDAGMRTVTQAEVPPQSRRPLEKVNGTAATSPIAPSNGHSGISNGASRSNQSRYGRVVNLTNLKALDEHLTEASNLCVTIFFTSATCPPCRVVYPTYDTLAGQHPDSLFVKVDINEAYDIAAKYQIRATPTFMTFSKGVKHDEWAGAAPALLKSNVERLLQTTFPPHPHLSLKLSTLQFGSMKPVTFTKIPPLDKLMAKLGAAGTQKDLAGVRSFVEKRNANPKDATVPDLQAISSRFASEVLALPVEARFAAVDLLRCAMTDPRVSGFFAEESTTTTVSDIVNHVNGLKESPHNLRLVTIHLACNTFTSPLYIKELMRDDNPLTPKVVELIASSLLDGSHSTTRVAAASLAFNIASANYRIRREQEREALAESQQVELAASLIETLSKEENGDTIKALLLGLGYLVYCSPQDGEVMDLCRALDAKATLNHCGFHRDLAEEVARLF